MKAVAVALVLGLLGAALGAGAYSLRPTGTTVVPPIELEEGPAEDAPGPDATETPDDRGAPVVPPEPAAPRDGGGGENAGGGAPAAPAPAPAPPAAGGGDDDGDDDDGDDDDTDDGDDDD